MRKFYKRKEVVSDQDGAPQKKLPAVIRGGELCLRYPCVNA